MASNILQEVKDRLKGKPRKKQKKANKPRKYGKGSASRDYRGVDGAVDDATGYSRRRNNQSTDSNN